MPLDEIYETFISTVPNVSRSCVYRVLHDLNKLPKEKREAAKKFKEYEPRFIHIDVTYLLKFDGKSSYLFVAIDRCARLMYYAIYSNKTAENSTDFLDKYLDFFPFDITHLLTDNGLEFTNRLLVSKKGEKCMKPSKIDEKYLENEIEHRLTKSFTP